MRAAAAISDPVRREILGMLQEGPRSAGELAGRFDISRPAVSRHLRVLRESGLVRDEVRGRRRIYQLQAAPLAELHSWLGGFQPLWETRLDALETEVYRTRRERRAGTTSRPLTQDKESA